MFDLAVLNGTIVTDSNMYKGDIYIKDEKIVAIGTGEQFSAKKIINADGKLIFPGLVDSHMHIGEFKADYEEMDTATLAAAAGGVTCLIDMPVNQQSPSIRTEKLFAEKKEQLKQKSYADFCMWAALCPDNMSEFSGMRKQGAVSFKSFLSGGGGDFPAPTMADVRDAMMIIKELGAIAGFHCEDNSIIQKETKKMVENKINTRRAFLDSRPLIAELMATQNIIDLARETGVKAHICHVSHPSVAKLIKEAKAEGLDISAETCVHYLVFSEQDLIDNGCLYKCAPPLRNKEASDELWSYVLDGTFDCIASDHSPGMPDNRDDSVKPIYEVGNGISGVQTMLSAFFDAITKKNISPTIISKHMAKEPAKRFGIYGKKGDIKVGFDADLVIFDPNKKWEVKADDLFYKQKISAYIGRCVVGKVEETILRGKEIIKDNNPLVEMGVGKFVTDMEDV